MFNFGHHASVIQCARHGDGQTLLFTHGLGHDENKAARALECLDGYRLTVADMPGPGQSKLPPDCDLNMQAAFNVGVEVTAASKFLNKNGAQ